MRLNNTVIVSNSDRANSGLITRIEAPKYMGAVIVCKGGNDPNVRLAIVDAVSKSLGLSSNEISVLKMK
jgi:stage III sporulation protein AG